MTDTRSSSETAELLPCPMCGADDLMRGECFTPGSAEKEAAVRCAKCTCRATLTDWQARGDAQADTRTPAITGRGEAQIASVLRAHLKIGGHDAWEGHYYYVDGIEAASKALASSPTQIAGGVREQTIEECAQTIERGVLPWDDGDCARIYRQCAQDVRALSPQAQAGGDAQAEPKPVTDEMVERAWAAMVGSDVAPICFQVSIIRADLRTGLEAVLAASPTEGR